MSVIGGIPSWSGLTASLTLNDLGSDSSARPLRDWHELQVDPQAVRRLDSATRCWNAQAGISEAQHITHAAYRRSP